MKTLNRKIHFFNPGHENAVRAESRYYTPPASVCRMMEDLALLPAWYGEPNDLVITNETTETSRFLLSLSPALRPSIFLINYSSLFTQNLDLYDDGKKDQSKKSSLSQNFDLHDPAHVVMSVPLSLSVIEAAPWGLSPHSIRIFESLQTQFGNFVIPTWNETYKILTGRQTALQCLTKLRSRLPEYAESLTIPRFCSTKDEIRQFITEYPPPYILKMPYSCSGRGLYRISSRSIDDIPTARWIEGAIRKQGVVSIEQALDKVVDFAMEFSSDGNGNIRFEGLAVFSTSSKGTYNGNMLGAQEMLEQHLAKFVPTAQLKEIQETLTSILAEVLGHEYQGYLGVDMLVYRKDHGFAIHPCIEINLRYTMGLVALKLSNRLIHPASQGQFIIDYHKTANSTYAEHLRMQAAFPLQLSDSKILSGYLSLCPVLPNTKYRAYILI